MRTENVQPNEATLKCLLPAYAITTDLRQVTCFHGYLIRLGFLSKTDLATGLIDIYSKCGSLEQAHMAFNDVPLKERDIISWSVIISGYGKHGDGDTALSLFDQMVQSGVEPNEVTFASILHACSHSGLVDEGLTLFRFMLKDHKVNPRPCHYTCVIDLLGRAGRLKEAYELITTMSCSPNHTVWGAFLAACVVHENVELGEIAAKWLFELEPENTGFGSQYLDGVWGRLRCRQNYPYHDGIERLLPGSIRDRKGPPALKGIGIEHLTSYSRDKYINHLSNLAGFTGNYILMGNIYAAVGRWEEAENVRNMIDQIGLRKSPAHSFIGAAHE